MFNRIKFYTFVKNLNKDDMSKLTEQSLIKAIRPVIMNCWNYNNSDKCVGVLINFAYYPKEFNYLTPPKVRFILSMESGRTQDSLNCDKYFVEFIDDILLIMYRYMSREV